MECAEYLEWVEHLVHCTTYNTIVIADSQLVLLSVEYYYTLLSLEL